MNVSFTKLVAFSAFAPLLGALVCAAQTVGPKEGWLIIDGGGVADAAKQRFVVLAGGPNANIVLIPTALSDEEIEMAGFFRGHGSGLLQTWGINPDHVTMLHTRDKARANSGYFIETLRNASGVVILGGRQWRLADAYLDTAVERGIKELLARGGVVFGTSAGATIQGSFLVRGDPKTNEIMMASGHERGFGLLSNSAIDQHLDTRGREHDLVKVIEKHPELLGIGIAEGAWIEVHGDTFTVFGGRVAVYDVIKYGDEFYYFLSPGERFDLRCVHVRGACGKGKFVSEGSGSLSCSQAICGQDGVSDGMLDRKPWGQCKTQFSVRLPQSTFYMGWAGGTRK
jgi:cyanophycinase